MSRAAFLDRDGVINRKPEGDGYITRWEELKILFGVIEATALLKRAGFLVIIVSNQRCVAKNLIAAAELEELHRRMCNLFAQLGAEINAVYYCPHETSPPCACRKPEPGMLLEAARSWDIDLMKSWMIGDSHIDIEAGKRAGCKTAWLIGSPVMTRTRNEDRKEPPADVVAGSLLDAVTEILRREQEPSKWVTNHPTEQLNL